MCALFTERKSTTVRPVRTGDVRSLMRLIDTDWRVQLRISPTELRVKVSKIPGFLAEDGVGLRGFMLIEPMPSNIALIVGTGLRDTWSVEPFLDLLLPQVQQAAKENGAQALVYIGNATWLIDQLEQRGFETREWLVAYERHSLDPPPAPVLVPATLRTAHYKDLPALLRLDTLAFEHIWHKSAGNFSEALARADSFTVAVINKQIVAYQWCEMYGKHAHLARLAVDPAFQGQGIGAQLLHRAITDALSLNANIISLNTQQTNHRSQALYTRFGFVSTNNRMPVLWNCLNSPNCTTD